MNLKDYPLVMVPNKYDVIIDRTNRKLSKEYSNWILSIKEERIICLKKFMLSQGIELDYSEKILSDYFIWFKNNLTFRYETEEEMKMYDDFKDIIIDNRTFTKESLSLIFDTALFWGNFLIKKQNKVSWFPSSFKSGKGDIIYAFPRVGKNEEEGVDPMSLISVVGYKLMDNYELEDEFNDLLNLWTDIFENE